MIMKRVKIFLMLTAVFMLGIVSLAMLQFVLIR